MSPARNGIASFAFGKRGEWAVQLKKGAHLIVEGSLRSREYPAKVEVQVGKKIQEVEVKRRVWEARQFHSKTRRPARPTDESGAPEPDTDEAAP